MKLSIWSILTVIVVCLLLFVLFHLYGLINKANNNYAMVMREKASMETELKKAYENKKNIESELIIVKDERESLASKIIDFESQMQNLTSEHMASAKKMTDEITRLKTALSDREASLPKKDAEIKLLKTRIRKSEKKIFELSELLSTAKGKTSVSLDPITITDQSVKIRAKVVEVNKDYGFIIINAGSADGIREGDTLYVYRKDNLLGKVLVEKADNNASVAKVLYKSLAELVRKDDLVTN